MFIFRAEHNRDECTSSEFRSQGSSLTGHGTFMRGGCFTSYPQPDFGLCKNAPAAIAEYERCAVTAEQFDSWIGLDYTCDGSTQFCRGGDFCTHCPNSRELHIPSGWSFVAYWVEDHMYGIDWRIDNEQIVFNPAFAINMGSVAVSEVAELANV